MDRSIKPGDVIVVGNTFGSVNKIGARAVSVVTRDGKEHLIPNEQLMTPQPAGAGVTAIGGMAIVPHAELVSLLVPPGHIPARRVPQNSALTPKVKVRPLVV